MRAKQSIVNISLFCNNKYRPFATGGEFVPRPPYILDPEGRRVLYPDLADARQFDRQVLEIDSEGEAQEVDLKPFFPRRQNARKTEKR